VLRIISCNQFKSLSRYWGIFWVDASTDDRIQQCFAQIARLLQVDENVDSVKRQLANTSQTWLLVFDNADDLNLSLGPYLPAGERGDIIITSRNPGYQHYNTVGSQEVERLSLDDSLSLLTKIIYGATSSSQQVAEEGKKIVEALGCLALAIVQAGAYIRETSCTLQEYLEIYETRKRNLLQYLPKHLGTDYQYSVYTTWQVSLDSIESRQDTVSSHTLQLLNLLGFYHHDQIPVQMFYKAWHQSQASQVPDYLPWHDTISDFFDYQQLVQASISLLTSFSLIARNMDASLTLHPLVHEWCRDRTSKDKQELSYRRALSLLTCSVEWKFETEDYTYRRKLVSHVHELLRLGVHQAELDEKNKIEAWSTLALILGENGWTRGALQLLEQVVELQKNKLGEDHPDTSRSMANLAIEYSEAGRRSEALRLSEEVLDLQKNKLGEDHPDILTSMANLAIRYSEAGRRSEALRLSEEVLSLRKNKLGEDHPDTLTSMANLAIRYSEAGRRSEALRLSEEVLNLRKNKLGEDHPDTLISTRLLAYVLEKTAEESPRSTAGHHSRHRLSKLWQKFRS
jgi:tetratricopeptide (TPR) repeat protein